MARIGQPATAGRLLYKLFRVVACHVLEHVVRKSGSLLWNRARSQAGRLMSNMFWSHLARIRANIHVLLTKTKVSQHGFWVRLVWRRCSVPEND